MAIRFKYKNIGLTVGILILLGLVFVLFASISADAVLGLLLPSGANSGMTHFAVTLGILITAAVGIVRILRDSGKE